MRRPLRSWRGGDDQWDHDGKDRGGDAVEQLHRDQHIGIVDGRKQEAADGERGKARLFYQLPKAEYNAVDDTWSVAYIGREKDKSAKHLSVVIQDKTGKAEVKR